jgi:hypothetical protein
MKSIRVGGEFYILAITTEMYNEILSNISVKESIIEHIENQENKEKRR